MAALARRSLNLSYIKSFKLYPLVARPKSDAHVVMTDDSSTIVCWHPETPFPYEKSLPIPDKVEVKSDSLLKVQSNKEFLSMLKPRREELVIQELMGLTFTTKHLWFPKKMQFRRKKAPEPDRPYL